MSALIAASFILVGQPGWSPKGPKIKVVLEGGKSFTITTDPKNYPGTVKAVSALVKKNFYSGIKFHRVEPWVVQWGDPQSKTLPTGDPRLGSGGSGHPMKFEGGVIPFVRGVVGIASTGAQVGGDSQLFVITQDAEHLYGKYAVLGKVTEGMKVVDNIKIGDKVVKMLIVK